MKTIFYPANERGTNDIGWLKAKFSFSFGPYYNPEKVHFGALRVLNDDIIAAGAGFGTHPHDNMEIVTIPLSGAIEHKDSMGNIGVIRAGEIQVMSAGIGITHSEYNHSQTEETKALQIWVFPKIRNIKPRYDQKNFEDVLEINKLVTLVSPDKENNNTLWVNQDATFSIGDFEAGNKVDYTITKPGNGAYLFIIEGSIKVGEKILNKRDALGIYDTDSITIEIQTDARILLIDIPMS